MPFTQKLFAYLWRKQADHIDELLRPVKEIMTKNSRGTVVEIGPGTGVNFKYLPRDISWIGVEINEELRLSLMKHPDLPHHWQTYSDIREIRSESADIVLSTIVLCSVPKLGAYLKEIKRVLKPGGVLISIEHVGAPRHTPHRALQFLIKPITRCAGGGCEPDRDIEEAIRGAGFSKVELIFAESVVITRIPFGTPFIGIRATK